MTEIGTCWGLASKTGGLEVQMQLCLAGCQSVALIPLFGLWVEDLLPVFGILHGTDTTEHYGEPGLGERL